MVFGLVPAKQSEKEGIRSEEVSWVRVPSSSPLRQLDDMRLSKEIDMGVEEHDGKWSQGVAPAV